MKKIGHFVEKSYKIIALFAIFFTLIFINYYHLFTESVISTLKYIIFIIIELSVLIFLNKFLFDKVRDKKLYILVYLFMLIFLGLEITSVFYFRVKYNWDFKWLMDTATDLSTKGITDNMYYFKIFPNNIGALIIVSNIMKIFRGNVISAYALNIVSVFLSMIFAALSARKIGGVRMMLNTVILIVLTAPLYLYTPIIYTDTLSVAVPVITLYLWLVMRDNKDKSKKKYYLSLITMVFVSCIGYFMKPVAAIVLVAVLIDLLFTQKKVLKDIVIAVVLFLMIITSYNKLTAKYILQDSRKNNFEFPTTHWLMMGLGKPESEGGTAIGYGSYSQKDADFTATRGSYEEKKNANIQEIKERLKNYGFNGYVDFLYKKCKYIWNDGTYYCLKLIGWDTLSTTSTPYKYVLGEKKNITEQAMINLNNTLFVLILIGFVIEVKNRKITQTSRVLGISIVGIAVFLMLWEARSRYVYFLIPVFCLLASNGLMNINNIVQIAINKIIKRKELESNE